MFGTFWFIVITDFSIVINVIDMGMVIYSKYFYFYFLMNSVNFIIFHGFLEMRFNRIFLITLIVSIIIFHIYFRKHYYNFFRQWIQYSFGDTIINIIIIIIRSSRLLLTFSFVIVILIILLVLIFMLLFLIKLSKLLLLFL